MRSRLRSRVPIGADRDPTSAQISLSFQALPSNFDRGSASTLIHTRLCWPLEWWPEIDQAAWTLSCTRYDLLEDDHHGTELRVTSLGKHRKGYGRWLSFLATRGWLDPTLPPLARVTRARLRTYFRYLRSTGNADRTIIGRFEELVAALTLLAPGEDVSWVRRPDGVSIYALLPKTQRVLMGQTATCCSPGGCR